ncbi:MAG: amidohydrolase 2 [Caulobacteraceae bacterium]|nr:amidohydrolase 2 [Caulobacteraceae bacterium]
MTQSAHKIIDMRSRPSFLHDFYGKTPGTKAYDTARWLNRRTGSHDDEHFARSQTVEAFVQEVRDAGIDQAVVVGRDTPALRHSNEEIRDLVSPFRELIGLGSVNPQSQSPKTNAHEIEKAVRQYGLAGINIEPGFGDPPLKPDHPVLFPVYEACQALGVPVFLMSGPTSPSLEYTDPAPVGRVASAFPDLQIVCFHGFYPYVNEIIGVAFRHPNVFVVPDMYIFLPGGGLYVEAANGFLRDQLLFGTSYPFRAMKQTVDDFLQLGWKDEVLDGILHGNAARVLKLQVEGLGQVRHG